MTEMWKATKTQINPQTTTEGDKVTRGVTYNTLVQSGGSNLMQNTFISDAIKVWNKAPEPIKTAKTVEGAKKDQGILQNPTSLEAINILINRWKSKFKIWTL